MGIIYKQINYENTELLLILFITAIFLWQLNFCWCVYAEMNADR